MRTRQDRATQIYLNALDMGCGFVWEGDDHVVVLSPTANGEGQCHAALQSVVDCYQPELCQLVPRHGVMPDAWRPATMAGKAADDDTGDKMDVIRRGVDNATKAAAKPKRYGQRKCKPKVAASTPSAWLRWAVPDEFEP